jgi:hypothetical protein
MLHQKLSDRVIALYAANPLAEEDMRKLLQSDMALGALCDIFSFALPLATEVQQRLLEEPNVEAHVKLLIASLATGGAMSTGKETEPTQRRFPPGFSSN